MMGFTVIWWYSTMNYAQFLRHKLLHTRCHIHHGLWGSDISTWKHLGFSGTYISVELFMSLIIFHQFWELINFNAMYVCVLVQVYTVKDRTEIEEYVPSAVQTCKLYDPTWLPYLDLKAKMEALWSKVVYLHPYKCNLLHAFAHKNMLLSLN